MKFADLLLDNGEIVRLECPDKFLDDFYETLDNAMKRGDQWSPSQFDGCNAIYLGIGLSRVNMKKVVGLL